MVEGARGRTPAPRQDQAFRVVERPVQQERSPTQAATSAAGNPTENLVGGMMIDAEVSRDRGDRSRSSAAVGARRWYGGSGPDSRRATSKRQLRRGASCFVWCPPSPSIRTRPGPSGKRRRSPAETGILARRSLSSASEMVPMSVTSSTFRILIILLVVGGRSSLLDFRGRCASGFFFMVPPMPPCDIKLWARPDLAHVRG